jgi:hypothetical protein
MYARDWSGFSRDSVCSRSRVSSNASRTERRCRDGKRLKRLVFIAGKTTGLKAGVNENGIVEHAASLRRLDVNEHISNP